LFAARFFSDINELPGTCRQGCVETPLGVFAAPQLPEGGAARVCIRPEHLRLATGPVGIAARVVRTACLGEVDHIVLAVPGLDTRLTVRAFGRTGLEADDVAYLELPVREALVLARE
jgi:iron(III) transport system ATP-binding protein